jgi:hypothetical protein
MRNKGGMAMATIVTLLIVITGFLIVFGMVFLFGNNAAFAQDSACKLSVLTRATTPSVLKGEVPLNCYTGKICITHERGGECEQFAGEEDVQNIRISKGDLVGAARIIEEVTAESMYSCWKMMGEGELDLSSEQSVASVFVGDWINGVFGEDTTTPSCVFCSRVALDKDFVYVKDGERFTDELTLEFREVSRHVNIEGYFEKTDLPTGEKKYLQEFTDSQITGYPSEFQNAFSRSADSGGNVDEIGVMFIQLITKGEENPFVAGGIFEKGKASLGSVVAAGNAVLGGFGGVGIIKDNQDGLLYNMLTRGGVDGVLSSHEGSSKKAIGVASCGTLTTAKDIEDTLYGCSAVRTVNYDNIVSLNGICNVEGNP